MHQPDDDLGWCLMIFEYQLFSLQPSRCLAVDEVQSWEVLTRYFATRSSEQYFKYFLNWTQKKFAFARCFSFPITILLDNISYAVAQLFFIDIFQCDLATISRLSILKPDSLVDSIQIGDQSCNISYIFSWWSSLTHCTLSNEPNI